MRLAILPAAWATCASRLATMAGPIATAAVCRSMTLVAAGRMFELACSLAASRLNSKPRSRASARHASNKRAPVHVRAYPVASAALLAPCLSATDTPCSVSRRLDCLPPFRERPFDMARNAATRKLS